jgi:hypothetical protein
VFRRNIIGALVGATDRMIDLTEENKEVEG